MTTTTQPKIKCSVEAQNQIHAFEKRMQKLLDNEIEDLAMEIVGNSGIDPEIDEDAAWDSLENVRNYLWDRIKFMAECPYMPI